MREMQSSIPLYFCLFVCILTRLITTQHFTKQKASNPVDHRVRTICQNHVKQKTMHSIVLHGAKRKSFSLEKHAHTHISLLDSKWPRHWKRRTITHTRTRMGKILAWLVVFPRERERKKSSSWEDLSVSERTFSVFPTNTLSCKVMEKCTKFHHPETEVLLELLFSRFSLEKSPPKFTLISFNCSSFFRKTNLISH